MCIDKLHIVWSKNRQNVAALTEMLNMPPLISKQTCKQAVCSPSCQAAGWLDHRDGVVLLCAQVLAKPVSNREVKDFGPGIGRRSSYLYHLPEVASTHKFMRVPSVSARFSTAPEFWNWAMWLVARLAPASFLRDPNKWVPPAPHTCPPTQSCCCRCWGMAFPGTQPGLQYCQECSTVPSPSSLPCCLAWTLPWHMQGL